LIKNALEYNMFKDAKENGKAKMDKFIGVRIVREDI
jgi:hypothetical protein